VLEGEVTMQIPVVSLSASTVEIAHRIACSQGYLVLTDLESQPPFQAIQGTFDELPTGEDVASRLHEAYTKNLICKDSAGFRDFCGHERVLDFNTEHLKKIKLASPEFPMSSVQDEKVARMLRFWESCALDVMPKLVKAISLAIGTDDVSADAHCYFRMVDYYERPALAQGAPLHRCEEHRDFGTASLIFPSDVKGLEIFADDKWQAVPPVHPHAAGILIFGWCTQIRSNGRIPAVLHRVVDAEAVHGVVPRRTSAVLFIAPKEKESPLEPMIQEGEARRYISGAKVGLLRSLHFSKDFGLVDSAFASAVTSLE